MSTFLQTDGILYSIRGMTNDIRRRMFEHKNKVFKDAFTKRYNVDWLLYYEECQAFKDATQREYDIKHLRREYKMQLITKANPRLIDLAANWGAR